MRFEFWKRAAGSPAIRQTGERTTAPLDGATSKIALKPVRCTRSCSSYGACGGCAPRDVTSFVFDIRLVPAGPQCLSRSKEYLNES